ncbi:hypothetical protein E2C01_008748 [Portunus trituberculatus]|uniref:Uncharacterized protein n=1 Tax=Portunus trituberculatus TaxID=210409 RepID=A0A5B7D1L3_PORTR|nr:hypothetical protein [Portunus trituberculatus]
MMSAACYSNDQDRTQVASTRVTIHANYKHPKLLADTRVLKAIILPSCPIDPAMCNVTLWRRTAQTRPGQQGATPIQETSRHIGTLSPSSMTFLEQTNTTNKAGLTVSHGHCVNLIQTLPIYLVRFNKQHQFPGVGTNYTTKPCILSLPTLRD